MRVPRRGLPLLPVAAAALWRPVGAAAQPRGCGCDHPGRPIAFVVPFLPGGSTNIAARILAGRMAPHLRPAARTVVENRARGQRRRGVGAPAGAGRLHPAARLRFGAGHQPAAALPGKTHYGPVEDFTPIAVLGGGPMVLVVPACLLPLPHGDGTAGRGAGRAGATHLGTSGAGGIGHLTGEWIKIEAGGLRAEHVPHRGGSAVMEALASAAPHLRGGPSRGLAVTSLQRHRLFPGIPTPDGAGLKNFEITTQRDGDAHGPSFLPTRCSCRGRS